MMRFALCSLLFATSCVSRTDLGAEPLPMLEDAGMTGRSDAGSAPDAMLSEEEQATRMFEEELIGRWSGRIGFFSLTLAFKPKSTYAFCDDELICTDFGFFFVTDRISNGNYAGELQDDEAMRIATMDDMKIDYSVEPPVLRFALTGGLFRSDKAELTRLPD